MLRSAQPLSSDTPLFIVYAVIYNAVPDVLKENLFSFPAIRRCILLRCMMITIAAIGIERSIYRKLLPKVLPSTTHDISKVASGQKAAPIMEAAETYFVMARITIKIARSAINTFGSTIRNEAMPTSTPLPPLNP